MRWDRVQEQVQLEYEGAIDPDLKESIAKVLAAVQAVRGIVARKGDCSFECGWCGDNFIPSIIGQRACSDSCEVNIISYPPVRIDPTVIEAAVEQSMLIEGAIRYRAIRK